MAEVITTSVFDRNVKAYADHSRIIINQGGTSSSKTFSILQLLLAIAQRSQLQLLISVVSESLPHLKRGCIRDMKTILGDSYDDSAYNHTDHIYNCGRSRIEFFPADDSTKLRGGRRDILFVNEANNITHDSFNELEVRTRYCSFIDFNPVSEFWAHELVHNPGVAFIKSTYRDVINVLPKAVVDSIESRRDKDPNWWRVYGLGEIGKIEGLIHPNLQICEHLPITGQHFYGLDFGFSSDPAVLVRCCISGDELYCDELIYETGLTNDAIARKFGELGIRKNYDEIFADAAEPKSIAEIAQHGYNIKPAPKGVDSVEHGIQLVNQYKQYWTKRSINAIKEQRNYRYIEDRNGKITDKPSDSNNHAMDARRYAVVAKKTKKQSEFMRIAI